MLVTSMDEDPESALVAELRALARDAPTSDRFTLWSGERAIDVTYVSGSSSSVTLKAGYDDVARSDHPVLTQAAHARSYRDRARGELVATRPMSIELRRESRGDVRAKRAGLAAEWESGDELFDDVVYVSSPTTDPAVLSAELGAEVRRAALTLIELGFHSVRIDEDGDVVARLSDFARPDAEPRRGVEVVEAFAEILANLPAVTHSGRVRPPPPLAGVTRVLRLIGLTGWALNVGYVGLVVMGLRALLPAHRGDLITGIDVGVAVTVGVIVGLFASSIYAGMIRERVRGTSDAPDVVFSAGLAAFGGVSVIVSTLGLTLAALWNLAADAPS
jgi:hypothetical protein